MASLPVRQFPLGFDRAGVGQELFGDATLLLVPGGTDGDFALLVAKRPVAFEELLHLHDVIGERFGGGIDGGESAADHDNGKPQLQVRDRIGFGRAGQLKRHEEVGGLANATRQIVLHVDHRGLARAHAERNVIEAHLEGRVHGDGAAESHAAVERKLGAALEQQAHHLQVVLVPADRDAVLSHAAEACHGAMIQRFEQFVGIADRAERNAIAERIDARDAGGQRLDLESIDSGHRVPVVHQVVRQRESGRAHAHDEHLLAGGRHRIRTREIERVPAREQAVDLETPRQFEHVFQRARLHLRNVHRLLLLKDARLHAVIADAVSGACAHRIVDRDDRERTHRIAVFLDGMHLGDLFLERAPVQRDAEMRLLEIAGLFAQAGGAAILALIVALDAVVALIERVREVHARVSELESFAVPPHRGRQTELAGLMLRDGLDGNQMLRVDLVGLLEQHAATMFLLALRRAERPGGIPPSKPQRLLVMFFRRDPPRNVACVRLFRQWLAEQRLEFSGSEIAIHFRHFVRRELCRLGALHELPLHLVEGIEGRVAGAELIEILSDSEEFAGELFDERRDRDDQFRLLLLVQRRVHRAG